jgi:plastocyanin
MDTDHYWMTFARPGPYDYFCSLHPHLTAKIAVKAP